MMTYMHVTPLEEVESHDCQSLQVSIPLSKLPKEVQYSTMQESLKTTVMATGWTLVECLTSWLKTMKRNTESLQQYFLQFYVR